MIEQLKLKLFKHLELLILLVVVMLIVSSCGGGGDDDPGPTPQELAFEDLAGTWTLANGGSITLDGDDVASSYTGFTLSFTNGGFTTSNAGDLFPATGTWQWVGESTNQITTGRGKQVTIITLTTSAFQFSFTKTATNSVAGVSGNYVIKVVK